MTLEVLESYLLLNMTSLKLIFFESLLDCLIGVGVASILEC